MALRPRRLRRLVRLPAECIDESVEFAGVDVGDRDVGALRIGPALDVVAFDRAAPRTRVARDLGRSLIVRA